MEKKIPSAEELLRETYKIMSDESIEDIAKIMREFAKLHVEACKIELLNKPLIVYRVKQGETSIEIDENLIVNSYPLENIK